MTIELLWVVLITILTFGEANTRLKEVCNPSDLKGLTIFKSGIHVDTSGRLAKWVGGNCCNWEGISCDNRTGRVAEINLSAFISSDDSPFQAQMEGLFSSSITLLASLQVLDLGGLSGLSGTLPKSIGFHLPELRRLVLYGNNLSGAIPESIGKLSKLEELVLPENKFSGLLPSSLGGLKNLKRLSLYSNRLLGSMPDSFTNLTSLVYLDLHDNSLTGHIPQRIGQLQVLEELDLSSNFLAGNLPPSLANLTSISVMCLDTNYLEGPIPFPSSSAQMSSLRLLRLHTNHLTGKIPPTLEIWSPSKDFPYQITSLREQSPLALLILFNVSHNMIQGPLPSEMSSLQNIQALDLSFNLLSLTSIPKWLVELPSLSRIYLAGCGIQGNIPVFLRSTPSPIQELDLSANNLTGSIPTWLGVGSLAQLYLLNLSRNSLVSKIPYSVTNLHDLGVLDLHGNKLSGSMSRVFEIGQGFPDGSLTYLDLSDNKFSSGMEQIGVGAQRGIQLLNLSNNILHGRFPTSIERLKLLQSLDLSSNKLGFNLPEAVANLSMLETLKLEKNRFAGKIPNEFLKLRKLKQLDLSDNLLVGEIPVGKPLSDFPQSSYSGNRGLCGKPLPPCKPTWFG
ncbi:putative leucine-rich repeat receptor-like protein kinase [Prunus yedoensis var. nudiflora]|uniref:Putative leucine-rich repeat receptor-like protein kinase n=1 Tax=Prunus yedoensis var. nudiflora TaxID=2094558 RepID=A0A314ZMZ5_PRUYE|nr:putative leucine-rich repeat receptor-like protein kinase [Prunus yedoensis var. nudiflora]